MVQTHLPIGGTIEVANAPPGQWIAVVPSPSWVLAFLGW